MPATGRLMAPEAERDKEVSPKQGDKPWGWGRAFLFYPTAPEHPWSKPCCSNSSPLRLQPWLPAPCFPPIPSLQDKHNA